MMESPHSDPMLGDDSQAFNSSTINFEEYEFVGEDGGELDGNFGLIEESSETNTRVLLSQSPNFPSRKVHSAAPASNGFGPNDVFEDIPRPYTSAGADSLYSSSSFDTRSLRRKKSAAARKKPARDDEAQRKERPRSADVNEWGDFDTDRLLDDFGDQSNQISIDPQDGQRSIRSRKSRRSIPTTSSPSTNPWDGYLTINTESKGKDTSRPPMQVLRQKSVEILNLDLVSQENQSSGRASASPKPLLGRVSFERLTSSQSRPITSQASREAMPPFLFGTEILGTPTNRADIFKRLAILWSLVSHHSASATEHEPADTQTRSPFECSMTMAKICKTVGISLTPSAAMRLSFWQTNEQGVDFESFCNLVIQGAIQPAFSHFNLDNSVGEYVSALDTVVQSLVTTAPIRHRNDRTASPNCPPRLKELNEIQPVFMSWKAGITPRLIQPPAAVPTPTATRALMTAEKVRRAVEASVSQHMLAHQLSSEEARVTHVENIRRKIQLHKSWKFSGEGKLREKVGPSPMKSVPRDTHEQRIPVSRAVDLDVMLDRARTIFPSRTDNAAPRDEGDHSTTRELEEMVPEKDTEDENEEVLVCCSCSIRSAVLWCSSCFTVNCQKCWEEVHSCTVDMSMVSSASISAKKPPLLGPTALAIRQKRYDNTTMRPPVAMVYLPTKAMVPGTIAKGNPIVRHNRNCSNQAPVAIANAILPSLHKSQSDGTIQRHHGHPQVQNPTTDSTADLMKALMLRASPPTPTSNHRSAGLMESTMYQAKHHTQSRPKLHLAPVSIDAALLLQ